MNNQSSSNKKKKTSNCIQIGRIYLDASAVLVASHAVNLIHDQHVFTAHCLRRTYNTNREAASLLDQLHIYVGYL